MNPVLILTRNCLELTKKCVVSVHQQTIPTNIYVWDNGSTDGTVEWLNGQVGVGLGWNGSKENHYVSEPWNDSLRYLFLHLNYPHVLVLNNDTIIPPCLYRELLSHNVPFVTASETQDMFDIGPLSGWERKPLGDGPDFSCFLIRRDCWERVGPFDSDMAIYCSDCDYDIRARRLGVPLFRSSVPYYHERSSTLRRASEEDQKAIHERADKDRAAFKAKYGCEPGTPEYAALFPSFEIRNPPEA